MREAGEHGSWDRRFRTVADRFAEFIAADPSFSAQLSVVFDGEPVVDLAAGPALRSSSVTGVYSSTKGVAALVIAHLIDIGRIDPDHRVADYWPQFSEAGKGQITVRQLLSHQAGLPFVERPLTLNDVADSRAAAATLAGQRPLWRPGSAFGYHALTIGVLMEELVRRVTGRTLQEIYETAVRGPVGADFHLGLPESEDARYVPLGDVELNAQQAAEIAARPPADAIATAVFSNFVIPDDRLRGGRQHEQPGGAACRLRRHRRRRLGGRTRAAVCRDAPRIQRQDRASRCLRRDGAAAIVGDGPGARHPELFRAGVHAASAAAALRRRSRVRARRGRWCTRVR